MLFIDAFFFFFFNDTATTEIYTLSLHDALPIYTVLTMKAASSMLKEICVTGGRQRTRKLSSSAPPVFPISMRSTRSWTRSEEHTSELQSRLHLVCRLLLEKKKKIRTTDCVRASS